MTLSTFSVGWILERFALEEGLNAQTEGIDDVCYGLVTSSDKTFLQVVRENSSIYNYQIVDGDPIRLVRRAVNDDLTIDVEINETECIRRGGAPAVSLSRVDPATLPRQVEIQHMDPSRDYAYSTQVARHTAAPLTNTQISIAIDFIISAQQARDMAFDLLYRIWSQQLILGFEHPNLKIEPGDVVRLTTREGIFTCIVAGQTINMPARTNSIRATILLTTKGTTIVTAPDADPTPPDPDGYDPDAYIYSLDYSKFYNSMYLLLLVFGGGELPEVVEGGGTPSGTPQLAGYLDIGTSANLSHTIAARPAWDVPGVDYYVGPDRALFPILKNPWPGYPSTTVNSTNFDADFIAQCGGAAKIAPAGNGIGVINASSIIIQGWSFVGIGLWIGGVQGGGTLGACSDVIVQHNYFEVTANQNQPFACYNLNVTDCTFRCNEVWGGTGSGGHTGFMNQAIGWGLVAGNSMGTMLIEYNYIHDAFSENMTTGSNQMSGNTLTIQYNLIRNAGCGVWAGAHGDFIQHYDGAAGSTDLVNCFYNFWLQDLPANLGGTQGLSLNSANISQPNDTKHVDIGWNTFVIWGNRGIGDVDTPNYSNVNFHIISDLKHITVASIHDNYSDTSGNFDAHFWINTIGSSGTLHGVATLTTNIDMATGSTIAWSTGQTSAG